MADLFNIDLSLTKIFLSNVDLSTPHVKIQNNCVPTVGTLMWSGMLFANYAKMIKAAFHLTIEWTRCWLAQTLNNKLHIHMKLLHWSMIRDWHSFLLFAGARHEHSIVSPLLQTNKVFAKENMKKQPSKVARFEKFEGFLVMSCPYDPKLKIHFETWAEEVSAISTLLSALLCLVLLWVQNDFGPSK